MSRPSHINVWRVKCGKHDGDAMTLLCLCIVVSGLVLGRAITRGLGL